MHEVVLDPEVLRGTLDATTQTSLGSENLSGTKVGVLLLSIFVVPSAESSMN